MKDTRRSFSMGRRTFLWAALMLLLAKATIFALGQSVFLIGSRVNLILSICTDLINFTVGILAALRMRDAGKSGVLGFFGCLFVYYGSLFFLIFSLSLDNGNPNKIILGLINVASQLMLLMFVTSISRVPSAGRSVGIPAKTPAVDSTIISTMLRRWTAPPSRSDELLALPMAWSVNQHSLRRWKATLFPTIMVILGIAVVLIGHPVAGISNIAIFGCLLFMTARQSMALRKIGPGRVTITADGFTDDRLDRVLVPWRSVTKHIVRTETKAGIIAGVLVISNLEKMRGIITKDYKCAYMFFASSRNVCLFIDLDKVEGAESIVNTVKCLIDRAR